MVLLSAAQHVSTHIGSNAPYEVQQPKTCLPTSMSFGAMQSLAENGRFGRGLAPEQQTFIVLSDAVMKQLDSLKNEEGPGRMVRRLMGEGLDQVGKPQTGRSHVHSLSSTIVAWPLDRGLVCGQPCDCLLPLIAW